MSLASTVKVVVAGDASGALRALKEVQKEAGNSGSKLATFGKLAAGGFAAVGVAAVAFGVSAVAAGDRLNESQDLLKNALKNTHQKIADLKDAIGPVQSQMEKWGYTNVEVNDGLSRLVSAGDKLTTATKDVALAANIARGRHIDLAAAESLLVKVRTGHVALLGRYGIATKDAQGKTISITEAVKRLSALYKGDAQTASESLAGKTAALKARFEDIKAHIGQALIPMLTKLAGWIVSTVIPALGKAATWVRTVMIPAIVAFGIKMLELYNKYIAPIVNDIVTIFKGLVKQVTGVFDLISDIFHGKWTHIGADLKLIVSGIVQEVEGLFWELVDTTGKILAGLAPLAWKGALAAGSAILHGIVTGIEGEIRAVVNVAKAIYDAIAGLINQYVIDPVKGFGFSILGHKFKPFGSLPEVPTLHGGGIFDGAPSGEGLALLQNGEGVFTQAQMRALGRLGGGGTQIITVHGANDPRTVQRLQDKWNRRNGIVPVTSP